MAPGLFGRTNNELNKKINIMKRKTILNLLLALSLCIYQSGMLSAQENNVQEKVDNYIEAYMQMNQFSGTILIAKNDQILANKGYGYANHAFNIENTPQTKFRIASLTKGFTAVVIMQLIENDKLNLDDKLIKFIHDFPRGDEISIEHLLTMTSGIPNHTDFDDFNIERRVFQHSILETIEIIKSKPLEFTSGTQFEYSNSNYILLGLIIEQIAGMSYAEYVKQNIFTPLEMDNSGYEEPEIIIEHMACGYRLKNDKIINAKYRDMSNAHASGALYSTVEDLYKWDRALYTEKLISNESKELMFTPAKANYGFGWGIVDVFNHKMIAHTGEIDGFTSNISRFIDDDICIIILSNFEHTPMNRINIDLISMVFDREYTIPEVVKVIKLSESVLQEYVGKYEYSPNLIFDISCSDGKLFCQLTGQPKFELAPISDSEFILRAVDAKILFSKNTKNEIDKLILLQGDQKIEAPKKDQNMH